MALGSVAEGTAQLAAIPKAARPFRPRTRTKRVVFPVKPEIAMTQPRADMSRVPIHYWNGVEMLVLSQADLCSDDPPTAYEESLGEHIWAETPNGAVNLSVA